MFSAWNKSIWRITCGLWQNHFIWCDLWKVKKVFLETPDTFEIKILEWSDGIHFNHSTPCLWAARCWAGSWGSRRWRVDERLWGEMRPLSSRSLSSEGAGSWVWAKCYKSFARKKGSEPGWGGEGELCQQGSCRNEFENPLYFQLHFSLFNLCASLSLFSPFILFLSFFLFFFFLYFSLTAWYGSLTRDQTWTLSNVSTKS